MKEIGQKGAVKLCLVPPAGAIISRAARNVSDGVHQLRVGLP